MHANGDVTALHCLADQRDADRREVLGKDRDDVDAQGSASSRTAVTSKASSAPV
jgi:hypothetical protein